MLLPLFVRKMSKGILNAYPNVMYANVIVSIRNLKYASHFEGEMTSAVTSSFQNNIQFSTAYP